MAKESKNDLKKPGSGGDREERFEEGGYPESNKVGKRSASNCRSNGVNPAISGEGTTLNKKLNYYYYIQTH